MGILGLYLRGGLGFAVISAMGSAAGLALGCFLSIVGCFNSVFWGFFCVLAGGLAGFFFGGSDGGVFGAVAGWVVCFRSRRESGGARIGGLVGSAAVGAVLISAFGWGCGSAGFVLTSLCSCIGGVLGAVLGFVAGQGSGWRGLVAGLLAEFIGFAFLGVGLGSGIFALFYSVGMIIVYFYVRCRCSARS